MNKTDLTWLIETQAQAGKHKHDLYSLQVLCLDTEV